MKTAPASSGSPREIDRMLWVAQDSHRQAGHHLRAWRVGWIRRRLRKLLAP